MLGGLDAAPAVAATAGTRGAHRGAGGSRERRTPCGLAIQLSQGQGRPAPCTRGGASGSGRAALQRCSRTSVGTRQSTPRLGGCQPYFVLSIDAL